MIRSKAFDCYSMSAAYRKISEETQIDFSAIIAFLECMPTFLNGDAHQTKRADLARRYARKSEALKAAVPATLSSITDTLKTHNGQFDVLNDLARPLWRAVAETLLPDKLHYTPDMDDLPDLFTPHTPLLKRKKCERLLRHHMRDFGPDILNDLALITLGARPFVNAVALSVHALAEQHRGQALSEISYPQTFPMSGLRYVDRIATERDDDTGMTASVGTRFRCIIVDQAYSAEQNASNLFGMGPHVCIGRQVSLMAWTELCARLAGIHKVVEAGALGVVESEPFENVVQCKIHIGRPEP